MRRPTLIFLMGCAVVVPGARANPIVSQTTPNGAAFAGVCAGQEAYGGLQNPGWSIPATIAQVEQSFNFCSSMTSGVGGTANASNSSSGIGIPNGPVTTPFNNNISFSATVGSMVADATSNGSAEDLFAGAAGGGGWNDAFMWNGLTGTLLMGMKTNALLTESGSLSGEAVLELSPTLNGNIITQAPFTVFQNINGYTGFGGTLSSFDFEVGIWTANSSNPSVLANQILEFAFPVVQGQQVNFGFWANFLAATGDGGDPTQGTQMVDPPSIYYAGPDGLVLGDNSIVPVDSADFGPSVSGFDYSQGLQLDTPEPGTIGLLLSGIGSLGVLRKRARRNAIR